MRPIPPRVSQSRYIYPAMKKNLRPYLTRVNDDSRIGTLWVECFYCGINEAIASGMNAVSLYENQFTLFGKLEQLGWKVAPRFKCRDCVTNKIK